MQQKDRLEQLLAPSNTTLNGIDFVEVASADETTLRIHFLNGVALKGTVSNPTITGGETIPNVVVKPIDDTQDWSTDAEGRPIFTLHVAAPGDFSNYTLTLASDSLDLFFTTSQFSFKALCPSDLDCKAATPVCSPSAGDAPPIDYLAKDFLSFRKALSDFSALRYSEWQERSEADFGVMFMESLSSLADDLSYKQDRVAAEATLDTATQRRSLVRHARLVDYEPRPATSARVLLQFDVQSGPIPSALVVSAQGPDGAIVDFETGTGLLDPATGMSSAATYPVSPAWNRGIEPYYWDDSQRCLKIGSTEMWVKGHDFNFQLGQALLIDTMGESTADPPLREVIHLTQAIEEVDLLFPDPPNPTTNVTHLFWSASEALKYDHDLTFDSALSRPRTILAGNLVPATQGRRYTETFAIDEAPATAPHSPLALVRSGPNDTPEFVSPQYLYTLRNGRLAWLAQDGPIAFPFPEIILTEQPAQVSGPPFEWAWRRSLLNAEKFESAFTVDEALYSRIGQNSDGTTAQDYDGDGGDTIRFGDGVFGQLPEPGLVFSTTYRVGAGAAGNVAADSITRVDPAGSALVLAVTNPFAAEGGADEEPDQTIRRLAPQAFRAVQFRAVRPEDYRAALETLAWVERAGATFRWTGSWLTVFATADPKGTELITVDEHVEAIQTLNRYRLAGYESYSPSPRYASLDLIVTVCAVPDAFRGDVESAILTALNYSKQADGATGFFYYDHFTFGQPLERSALEAAIQDAYGVAGVVSIQYRERGVTSGFIDMLDRVEIGSDQILRVDNDPSRPERGSLQVIVKGGK
jgi:baseplate J-like protein